MRCWKARNFREQGQLQKQLWHCVTLTTSPRLSLHRLDERQLSIGCPPTGFRSTLRIYECAQVIACPKLLLFCASPKPPEEGAAGREVRSGVKSRPRPSRPHY